MVSEPFLLLSLERMVMPGDKNKSTDDNNTSKAALQSVVHTLEHRLQPLERRLDSIESFLQSFQTSMVTIIQSLSRSSLDPFQPKEPLMNVQHQTNHDKIKFHLNDHNDQQQGDSSFNPFQEFVHHEYFVSESRNFNHNR